MLNRTEPVPMSRTAHYAMARQSLRAGGQFVDAIHYQDDATSRADSLYDRMKDEFSERYPVPVDIGILPNGKMGLTVKEAGSDNSPFVTLYE